MKPPAPLTNFLRYFLWLGTFGFGGPIVLAGHMRDDLVEDRKWFSIEDYNEGLAFAQLSPGPLAAQLAMYLGWIRAGALGATLTGFVFILPSFLMVVALAALYLRYGTLAWIQALFYSIGAAVIGIIAKSAYQLTRKTMGKDWLLWIIFFISTAVTIITESEMISLFVIAGIIALLIKAPPRFTKKMLSISLLPAFLLSGLRGPASIGTLAKLGIYFTKVGAIVFGSGLAIVPFLHGGVVQQFHWLKERQFLDSVAVGMITPGPIVITSGFIGYLVAGLAGAIVAALGVFLPAYLFVIILAPYYHRFATNPQVRAFVNGLTAAAIGGIAGAAVVLGKHAIVDIATALIAIATLAILVATKKVPEPVLILIAGIIGLILKGT